MNVRTPAWLVRYLHDPIALATTHRIAGRTAIVAVPTFVASAVVASFSPSLSWIPELVFLLGAAAVVGRLTLNVLRWWRRGPVRWGIFAPKARRAYMRDIWNTVAHDALDRDVWAVRVVAVTSIRARGCRAIVEHPDGRRQDAWFWHVRPRRGHVYLVRATGAATGIRDQHRVMYVGSDTTGPGIIYRIPRAAWRQRTVRIVRFQ